MNVIYPQAPTERASPDRMLGTPASARFAAMADRLPDADAAVADCQEDLWLTIFFDGTGNNEKIDAPTFEHSNVARLHRARKDDSESAGRYSFYVPGIGTPFREVGDARRVALWMPHWRWAAARSGSSGQ